MSFKKVSALHSVGRALRVALFAATLAGVSALAADVPDKKTERAWKAKCASCHGTTGKGDTDQGKKLNVRDMTTADYQKALTDEQIKKSLSDGVKDSGGVKYVMPSFGNDLKPDQIDALLKYVRSLGPKL